MFSLEQTEVNGGSLTLDGGAVCLDQSSNKWTLVTGIGAKNCEDCLEILNCVSQSKVVSTLGKRNPPPPPPPTLSGNARI